MNLSKLAIRRPVATLMAVCVIILLGIVSFTGLPLDLFPDFEFPIAAVITNYEGAAPAEVENMVSRPLEQALATVQGVENISSISQVGMSLVLLEFNWGIDLDMALMDARENIDLVKGFLPDDADDPMVLKADPSMMPIVQLSLYGDREDWELRRLAEDIVEPRLERVQGVASVDVVGGRTREIQVAVDPRELGSYGISLEEVSRALGQENFNISAGSIQEGGRDYQLRAVGEFASLQEMENLIIRSNPGQTVLLKDVATVEDGFREATRINRFNGDPSIGLLVSKQADANTVRVSSNVQDALSGIESALPEGVQIRKVMDQADFINESIQSVFEVGGVGALLAGLVLLFFLRSFRSTMVVALSIPVSVVATFVLMYFYGLTLNIVSLGGLALGIGIMVDSSIVVLENIYRFRQEGRSMRKAAGDGATQVAGAITAATLTTVVVFLPVVFMEGFASQIFMSMALTVSFSLLAALAVALTVVPALSSRLLARVMTEDTGRRKGAKEAGEARDQGAGDKSAGAGGDPGDAKEKGSGAPKAEQANLLYRMTGGFHRYYHRLENRYRSLLEWSLLRRKLIMAIFVLSFVASFALVPFIGAEFLPQMDEGYISVRVELPTGSALEETDYVVEQVHGMLATIPEVQDVYKSIGGGGGMDMGLGGGGTSHRASLDLILSDLRARDRSAQEIAEEIRGGLSRIAGAEYSVSTDGMTAGGMGGMPIDIAVRGDDLGELERITEQMAVIIARVPGTREVSTSFDEGRSELKAVVDREKAANHGLAFAQVGSALRTAVSGSTATRYRTGAEELDVRVILPDSYSRSLAALEEITLTSPYGYPVPLKEVTTFLEEVAPMSINRYNQVRSASVEAQVVGRSQGEVMNEIMAQLDGLALPEGYFIDYEGEFQMMQESFEDLALALLLAIILVYMIMAAQFESLLHPFIIMFALPQTFTGVALALFLTGRSLNVASFIGVIMLSGIVVNNGIVLVDYINKLRELGRGCREAVLEAGPVRLRPIMMTTLTTVLAMFPMALGIGSGAELRAPMATVVIGGLLFSTLITLIVIPVVYTLVEDVKTWARARTLGSRSRRLQADK